jgi:hypothetical protein
MMEHLVDELEAFVRAVIADATSDDIIDSLRLSRQREQFLAALHRHLDEATAE